MPDSAPAHAARPVPGPPGAPVTATPGAPVAAAPLATSSSSSSSLATGADAGDPRVPEALSLLGGLEEHPPSEHVARLEHVHRLLQDALASLDGT